jgi:hypothetical protein
MESHPASFLVITVVIDVNPVRALTSLAANKDASYDGGQTADKYYKTSYRDSYDMPGLETSSHVFLAGRTYCEDHRICSTSQRR